MRTKIVLLFSALISAICVNAQDIQITKFERNYTSLIASMNQVKDNNGEACAVIRFLVREKDFQIEANLGVVKKEVLPGEIRLWVPSGTKRITTIRYKNLLPLTNYEIPVQIEPKVTYEATLEITESAMLRQKANKDHNVYVGAGYNIMSLSGPSVAIGVNVNHHQIELGACYGLNKTDDLYFYDSKGDVIGGYNYGAIRANLSYGYEIMASDFFAVTPLLGASYVAFVGTEVDGSLKNSNYSNANSLSVTGGVRFTISVSDQFKLCVTPEYDVAVYKDNTCKLVSKYDDTMKNWHTGFNLNVGFMFFF